MSAVTETQLQRVVTLTHFLKLCDFSGKLFWVDPTFVPMSHVPNGSFVRFYFTFSECLEVCATRRDTQQQLLFESSTVND